MGESQSSTMAEVKQLQLQPKSPLGVVQKEYSRLKPKFTYKRRKNKTK